MMLGRSFKEIVSRLSLCIGVCLAIHSVLQVFTAYLQNGGTVENAQRIAAHESPRTTKLYDRTWDEINLGEVEKINI